MKKVNYTLYCPHCKEYQKIDWQVESHYILNAKYLLCGTVTEVVTCPNCGYEKCGGTRSHISEEDNEYYKWKMEQDVEWLSNSSLGIKTSEVLTLDFHESDGFYSYYHEGYPINPGLIDTITLKDGSVYAIFRGCDKNYSEEFEEKVEAVFLYYNDRYSNLIKLVDDYDFSNIIEVSIHQWKYLLKGEDE